MCIRDSIRTGQVRVNSSRSKPSAKVKLDDIIRIPPYKGLEELKPVISKEILNKTEDNVLFEDRNIIVFNKPTALTVHSGTKSGYGLIDVIRQVRNDCERIDLLHRLDKDTSGCIIFTKNLKMVDRVIAFDDSDDTACHAIFHTMCTNAGKIIFANGGDRTDTTTPEMKMYGNHSSVEFAFGVGGDFKKNSSSSVSYTHLTLPTNREV